MDNDFGDNYEFLYDEEDAPKHEKLVEKVLSLNKIQHLKKPSRTEPTLQISEFDLVKSITGAKGSVQINELTKTLKNRKISKIGENVERVQKRSHTLPKPLEKPQANRIRRSVAYEKSRLQLDRWEATISANRVSTNLSFPLNNDLKMDKKDSENFATMWRVKSKLEEELEKHEPKVEEFHIGLEEEKFPLTLKEMLIRRKEAAKLRAYQGYKEAKARRQNKIKSKKYHRIQKRERIKKKLKEFEQLQKTNPEEALKKLEEIEKSRVQERFSLRHKSTGKWAKNQQIRAKYDKESRRILAEQLKVSKELTQKINTNESESEDEENAPEKTPLVTDENNPWVKPGKEVADFVSGYRKYWMEKKQTEQLEGKTSEEIPENHVEVAIKENTSEKVQERQKKTKTKVKKTKVSEGVDESKSTSEWDVSLIEEENDTVIKETKIQMKNVKKLQSKINKKNTQKKIQDKKENKIPDLSLPLQKKTPQIDDDGRAIEDIFDRAETKIQKEMLKNVKKLQSKIKKKNTQKKTQDKKENKTPDLSLPIQKKTPQIDEELIQNTNKENESAPSTQDLVALKNILSSETKENQSDIDPTKYLKVKATNLNTAIPNILTTGGEEEEETDQRDIIAEAFEDDDVLDEFNKEKNDEIDKDKPKNINLNLPGWGSWGGTNIKVNKRKKRRFTVKVPKKVPRRDDNKGSLIINEKAQSKIKEHMVSEVPFPFKTVKDFEASMRAPISNTFVPETAYRRLIRPVVTTKMGAIIAPMSKDILLNKNG